MDTEITPADYAELLERNTNANVLILELEQKLDQVTSAGQIPDDEAQDVPQSRGMRAIFHFIRSFWL
jgi:hypothetical protein